jgi:hypothetical protein
MFGFGPVYLQVGDVVSMRAREYSWWERALRRVTFGRFRPRGRYVKRVYTITSEVSDAPRQ